MLIGIHTAEETSSSRAMMRAPPRYQVLEHLATHPESSGQCPEAGRRDITSDRRRHSRKWVVGRRLRLAPSLFALPRELPQSLVMRDHVSPPPRPPSLSGVGGPHARCLLSCVGASRPTKSPASASASSIVGALESFLEQGKYGSTAINLQLLSLVSFYFSEPHVAAVVTMSQDTGLFSIRRPREVCE